MMKFIHSFFRVLSAFKILSLALFLMSLQNLWAFTTIIGGNGIVSNGWGNSTVTFDVDVSCDAYRDTVDRAINASAQVWGSVPTSKLKVALGETVELSQPITTYVGSSASAYAPSGNAIVYCDEVFDTTSPSLDADSIPGFATGYNVSSAGKISGCLLVLNFQPDALANVDSLDTTLSNVVLAHEVGHCLGIGHSEDKEALMNYATGPGRKLVLGKDDMDAVTFLYPRDELKNLDMIGGCGAVDGKSDTKGGGGMPSFSKALGGNSLSLLLGCYLMIRVAILLLRNFRSADSVSLMQ